MKHFILSILIIISTASSLQAQSKLVVSKVGNIPNNGLVALLIIITHNHEYRIDTTITYKKFKVKWIKNLNTIRPSVSLPKYGPLAKYGAILVSIDDIKYPNAFKKIKEMLIEIEPNK